MHLVDINSVNMDNEPLFNAATDVVFRIWTRQNNLAGIIVRLENNADLAATPFSPARQTRFHVHGKEILSFPF